MLGIVNYSDSDSDGESPSKEESAKENLVETKRRNESSDSEDDVPSKIQKLPLPKLFGDRRPRKKDISDKHEGRKRTFDHFEGNWATYVYIPVQDSTNFNIVYDRIVKCLQKKYANMVHTFPLNSCHISISKTVPIRHYWMTPIFEKLKELYAGKKKFYYTLASIKVYTNDNKTRTFIGLDVSTGHDTFIKLVERTDEAFKAFDLEKYYESPSFHASLAWSLGNKKEEFENLFKENGPFIMAGFPGGVSQQLVEKICMKSGNKLFQIALE